MCVQRIAASRDQKGGNLTCGHVGIVTFHWWMLWNLTGFYYFLMNGSFRSTCQLIQPPLSHAM